MYFSEHFIQSILLHVLFCSFYKIWLFNSIYIFSYILIKLFLFDVFPLRIERLSKVNYSQNLLLLFNESFLHQPSLMVFDWSLSDSNSPQLSRSFLSILDDFNNAVV